MSDGKEVKRWEIKHVGNGIHSVVRNDDNDFVNGEFVAGRDHDRIVAELKAAAYKVYQQMSATIGHDKNTIDDLRAEVERTIRRNIKLNEELAFRDAMILDSKKTIAELRAEVASLASYKVTALAEMHQMKAVRLLHETIATQARVIEIAKRVLHNAGLRPPDGGTPTVETICEDLSDAMTEIAAIEKEGAKDE